MRRAAIAIGVVVILAAGAALWALTRPSRGPSSHDTQTASTQRSSHQDTGAGNGQAPGGSPGAAERGAQPAETREHADTRGQADRTDKNGTERPAAPGAGLGGWGPPPDMSEADRAKMREQMLERMLDEAGLTTKEKSAARAAIKAKDRARQALADRLTSLRRTANKSKPTDKELKDALAAYRLAMARYRKQVAAEDAVLVKQLSLRGQVRCISLGVLDNGLGGFGPGGPGGPRPPR